MEWDNGATIGFNAGGNAYANNDPSSNAVACVNTPSSDWSNIIYLLTSASPEEPNPSIYAKLAVQYCLCKCLIHIIFR